MKNLIFIITVISLSVSIGLVINMNMRVLTDNDMQEHRFLLSTSVFFTIVGWILLMLNNQLKSHSDEKD